MALQPKIIACGKSLAVFSMAVRFLVGPAVIAVTSIAVGLRGVLLQVAIIQVDHPKSHLKRFYLFCLGLTRRYKFNYIHNHCKQMYQIKSALI